MYLIIIVKSVLHDIELKQYSLQIIIIIYFLLLQCCKLKIVLLTSRNVYFTISAFTPVQS